MFSLNLGTAITTALFPCLTYALLLAIGFLLVKIKKLDKKGIDTIIMIMLNVLIPLMVFKCVYDSGMTIDVLLNNYKVLVGALIVFVVLLIVHLLEALILRLKPESKWIYMLTGGFGNTGMVGVPIVLGIFSGSDEVMQMAALGIALYTLPDIILAYTLAPYFSKKHLNGKVENPMAGQPLGKRFIAKVKDIFNPVVIGVVIGIIFCFAGIKLPSFLYDVVAYAFNGAVVCSALYLGGLMGFAKLAKMFTGGRKYVHIVSKMFVMPIILFLLLGLLDLHPVFRVFLAMMAAMPTNCTLPAFAHMYHADEDLAVELNLMGTIVAIISMPLIFVICSLIAPEILQYI